MQIEKLREAGRDKIHAEKKSGLEGKRQELARCLDYVREGDVLVVTRLEIASPVPPSTYTPS